jgi:hypothetical protein
MKGREKFGEFMRASTVLLYSKMRKCGKILNKLPKQP